MSRATTRMVGLMWYDDLGDIGRVAVVGVASYAVLVLVLRTSGKRTLAKLNAFDLVVTVALGSVLATSLLSPAISFSEAITAFGVLAGAQYVVAALSARFRPIAGAVQSRPRALVVRGRVDHRALVAERVSMPDVRASIRRAGIDRIAEVDALVLETDGSMSVVGTVRDDPSSMADVQGWPSADAASAEGAGAPRADRP